jgi:flavin reductase (DIM6/NTAB) family NADH-FMN oxidoreductase RutF
VTAAPVGDPRRLQDPPTTADIAAYRVLSDDLAAHLAVVAARSGRSDVAATVDSYLDISWDPPTMCVALYEGSRIEEAVDEAGRWTLSLLAADQQGAATLLGTPGRPVHGLLDGLPHQAAPDSGAAVLDGAIAWFDLRTVATTRAATHVLVIGEVTAMGRGLPEHRATDPLLRFGSAYRRLR